MLSNPKLIFDSDKFLRITLLLFVTFLLTSFLFSGAPMPQQFWGMFGRNTGLLAYLSLAIILYATAIIQDIGFYSRLVGALISTGIPMTLYCLVQISGNDPIGWSSFQTFGTLGNVNFLSAFLGLVCVAMLPYFFFRGSTVAKKVGILSLLLIDIYIIQITESIQGVFVFAVGAVVVVFLRLKSSKLMNLKQSLFSMLVIVVAIPSVAGLANTGPLAPYLFQNSIVLRTDYWHAGFEMTLNKPIFGVGLDSYGDWYRQARGEISTLRGSPDRTANTAHNIFLDLSSNGGMFLLLAYLVLLGLALRASFKLYKRTEGLFDPVFAALFAAWMGYQIQALVSINQLGVGVWGWILTGALIGYEKVQDSSRGVSKPEINKKVVKKKLLPAYSAVMGIAGLCFGFLLAWFPLNADSRYFSASKSADWLQLVESVDAKGSTAWHLARTADTAFQSQAFDNALQQANKLVERYPRDTFGWRVILYAPNSSIEQKSEAKTRLHELDPFNPEFSK
jgi:O-antigen ligase